MERPMKIKIIVQCTTLALLIAGVSFTPQTAKADYAAYKTSVLANSPTGFWDANQASASGIPDATANARNLTFGSDTSTWSISTGSGPMAGAGTWAHFTPYPQSDDRNTSTGIGAYNIQPGGLLSSFQLAADFSIEAWIKSDQANIIPGDGNNGTTSGQKDWGIIFGTRGYSFGINTTGELHFVPRGTNATDFTSAAAVSSGWNMVNVVFASTGPTFYINGVNVGTSPNSAPGPFSGYTALAGDIVGLGHRLRLSDSNLTANLQPYQGDIGQVAFFSGVLSDTDISNHYAAAAAATVPEPGSLVLLGIGAALTLMRRCRK